MADKEESIALPLVWIDPDSVEVLIVNQMTVQRQGEEYFMMFGQQSPPMLTGTPDEKKAQAEKIPFVPIRPAVRLGTTAARFREFVMVLSRFLETQDAEGRTDD